MEQQEKVKKEIRSLLMSQKGGCTMGELLRDYRNFNGRECPYRELGYASFREFIYDSTDVARSNYENGREVLVAVTTEETAHIAKMIARQRGKKTTKRGSGPPSRRPSASRPWSTSSMSSLSSYPSVLSSYGARQPFNQPRAPIGVEQSPRQPALPSTPQSVQRRIADVVARTPSGCSLDGLQAAYSAFYNGPINFKHLGYASFLQMLETMPKYVTLQYVPARGTCVFPVCTENPPRTRSHSSAGTSEPGMFMFWCICPKFH